MEEDKKQSDSYFETSQDEVGIKTIVCRQCKEVVFDRDRDAGFKSDAVAVGLRAHLDIMH